MCFPWECFGFSVKYSPRFINLLAQTVMNAMQETRVLFLGWADPLEEGMATHSSIFAWRIPGTGSLVGCCLWGRTESDTTETT